MSTLAETRIHRMFAVSIGLISALVECVGAIALTLVSVSCIKQMVQGLLATHVASMKN